MVIYVLWSAWGWFIYIEYYKKKNNNNILVLCLAHEVGLWAYICIERVISSCLVSGVCKWIVYLDHTPFLLQTAAWSQQKDKEWSRSTMKSCSCWKGQSAWRSLSRCSICLWFTGQYICPLCPGPLHLRNARLPECENRAIHHLFPQIILLSAAS